MAGPSRSPVPCRAALYGRGLASEPALSTYGGAHRGASIGDLFSAMQTDCYWRASRLFAWPRLIQ